MKYFEATSGESLIAIAVRADSLFFGIRLFRAYLMGLNERGGVSYQMTAAGDSKRRGVTYQELDI